MTPDRFALALGWTFKFSSYLVTKRHHAAPIAFDLRQGEGDISVELLEEADPITDQDRADRLRSQLRLGG